MRNAERIMKRTILAFVLTLAVSLSVNADDANLIKLPKPKQTGGMPLFDALKNRKSSRDFDSKPLSDQMVSNLLWAASGVNRADGKRTAPSARNWQEISVYVAMEKGLFLYDAQENVLKLVMKKDIREAAGKQAFTKKVYLDLIYVAELSKMKGADKTAQLFYSATDTGFISQNVYLFCASEGLATVVLGWVDKPALEKIMGLKKDQKVILSQAVGYPGK